MPEAPYGKSNYWLTVILITPQEFGADREAIRLSLEKKTSNLAPSGNRCICNPFSKTAACAGERLAKIYLNEDYVFPPEPR